ncbi:translation initiation factor 2 subunit 1 [Nematocida sp. AWRm77]|nr:translation initiation factor 2 subunit 1 [Nematocida sp. AWRm77]
MESNQLHRYYFEKYPKEGEVVVGRIKTLTEIGAYITLPEYNEIEALVVYSELIKKRTRNIHKYIKIGGLDGFYVLKVDKEKGYIDLSKKRAQYEEKLSAFERYYKGKIAHNFMQSAVVKTGSTLSQLYKDFGWEAEKEWGSLYKCFREVLAGEKVLQSKLKRTEFITDDLLDQVESLVKQKFVVPKIKIRADAEVKCNKGNGVLVVREVLLKLENEYPNVDISLVSSPVFSFSVMCEDGEVGEKVLTEVLEKLEKRLEGGGGAYSLFMPPTVFGPKAQFEELSEEGSGEDSSEEDAQG